MSRVQWKVEWSFTGKHRSHIGGANVEQFSDVARLASGVAQDSLSGLSKEEGDAMDAPWNALLAALELRAEREAKASGKWEYRDDGWAEISVEYLP